VGGSNSKVDGAAAKKEIETGEDHRPRPS